MKVQQHVYLQDFKTFSSCQPKEEWSHAGLYNYNGKQIELFYMKWF